MNREQQSSADQIWPPYERERVMGRRKEQKPEAEPDTLSPAVQH